MLSEREASLVTLYAGDGETTAAVEALASQIRARHGIEVEVVMGGQPHYPYIVGVE
jgi:dihydroxyacetone kinase-like predicted kinase